MRIAWMKLLRPSNHLCIPEPFRFQALMKRKRHAFIIASVWVAIFGIDLFNADPSEGSAAYISQPTFKSHIMIKLRTEKADADPSASLPTIYYRSILLNFYEKRDFNPLWTLDNGLTSQADQLIRAIEKAELDGLISEEYHLFQIKSLIEDFKQALLQKQSFDPKKQADLDLLLTDAFLLFSSHLLSGRVIPNTVDSTWLFLNPVSDIALILNSDAYSNRIESFFDGLRPAHAAYYRLRNALQQHIGIQKKGGWPSVPSGPSLRIGDTHDRVDKIRRRLHAMSNTPNLTIL
jgi:murein L,D-transpeptidase YcbB/YkuD